MNKNNSCKNCLKKDKHIEKLKKEKEQWRTQSIQHKTESKKYQAKYEKLERKIKEGYYGSSTPSSMRPNKAKTKCNHKRKNGGAKYGHIGTGRNKITEDTADEIINLKCDLKKCPICNGKLVYKDIKKRGVIDVTKRKVKKTLYKEEIKYCERCKKSFHKKPAVLEKSLYGNQLIAESMIMHLVYGIPVGKIEQMYEFITPNFFEIFHRIAKLLSPAMPQIIMDYRIKELIRHADETGWRCDGMNGYAWIFCSKNIIIFTFRLTRSNTVVKDIMGTEDLFGVLIVDRYNGYNIVKCKIQYCYCHLLRNVKDLAKEFPDNIEIQKFVKPFAKLLKKAIQLRNEDIADDIYYKKANKLKRKILRYVTMIPAQHPGIQNIQLIFKENKNRLFHWVDDRNIPAENNFAERELRPTVIARKVSFGSQSEKGLKTRSILMTYLHTAKRRLKNKWLLIDWFKDVLDKLSLDPAIDPYTLLPPPDE